MKYRAIFALWTLVASPAFAASVFYTPLQATHTGAALHPGLLIAFGDESLCDAIDINGTSNTWIKQSEAFIAIRSEGALEGPFLINPLDWNSQAAPLRMASAYYPTYDNAGKPHFVNRATEGWVTVGDTNLEERDLLPLVLNFTFEPGGPAMPHYTTARHCAALETLASRWK